jgi:acetylornithine/succinyldiaminopimelate/putrescine aminotransferase
MAKETVLQSCWLGYGEDKILRMRVLEGATIDLQQAKLITESMMRLADETPVPVLIDGRQNYTWDKDAQEYIAQHSGFRLATALITNNAVVRIFSNSYAKVFKPSYPLRIFTNEEKAVAWLKEMMGRK